MIRTNFFRANNVADLVGRFLRDRSNTTTRLDAVFWKVGSLSVTLFGHKQQCVLAVLFQDLHADHDIVFIQSHALYATS